MIGYAMVGTNDLEKAKSFYDSVLAELGAKRTWGMDRLQAYATSEDDTPLVVCRPHDGKAASFGNGTMIAVRAASREVVDKVYKKALASGAKDEGKPGLRGETFYGAYFRDLDGNKLCVYKSG
jgi:predicted lactoylglutathione lyase